MIVSTTRPDLNEMYRWAETKPGFVHDAETQAKRISVNQLVYHRVTLLTGIPFKIVGVMHAMEGNCDLTLSIRDGSPLAPGQDWANDAIQCFLAKLKEFGALPADGSRDLELVEAHNGFGYRTRGIFSPYLWSGTQFYTNGKFVKDGVFDPLAVSAQTGAVPILKAFDSLYPPSKMVA